MAVMTTEAWVIIKEKLDFLGMQWETPWQDDDYYTPKLIIDPVL